MFMRKAQKTTQKLHCRLILIDIENYNGGPISSLAQSRWCHRTLLTWIEPQAADLVILAADETTVTHLHGDWGCHRILAGHGRDGADLRLLDVLDENIADRFHEIVLVSGDRIFAERISQLAGAGIPTTVYSHAHCLSKRLAFAATTVLTSPTTSLPTSSLASPLERTA